jgi:hypothetical protein
MSQLNEGVFESYNLIPYLTNQMKKVSIESGAAYWDLFKAMGGKNSMPSWVEQGLAGSDYIHFTSKGTSIASQLFYDAFISASEMLCVCNLLYVTDLCILVFISMLCCSILSRIESNISLFVSILYTFSFIRDNSVSPIFNDDDISKNLTATINLMAAGRIPASVLPFLNAGRGVAILKNDEGELRPIVVGHVLLRLIGSLAMSTLSGDIQRYFLKPDSALQFGVGVQGGCELMAMAIATHMEEHPDHVDISCDARNASIPGAARVYGARLERISLRYMPSLNSCMVMPPTLFSTRTVPASSEFSTPWDPARAAASALSCTVLLYIPIWSNYGPSTPT